MSPDLLGLRKNKSLSNLRYFKGNAYMSESVYMMLKRMIPIRNAEEIVAELKNFKNIVANERISNIHVGLLDEVDDVEAIGIFTDGSNSVSKRRSAGVAVFSVSSLAFKLSRSENIFLEKYLLTPDKCFLILIPRFYIGTRANNIMKAFEYLCTLYMIDRIEDANFAVIDGSYISTLLSARWGIEHLYRDFHSTFSTYYESRSDIDTDYVQESFISVCNYVGNIIYDILSKKIFTSSMNPRDIALNFFEKYVDIIDYTYSTVMDRFDIPEICRIPFMNYLVMFFETNFMVFSLLHLLEKAREKQVFLLWLNKEPDSRILTKTLRHGIFRMFTDAFVLDFSLENNEYLFHTGLPPIEPSSLYVKESDPRSLSESSHVLVPYIADVVYGMYGAYDIIYIKYSDYVIQYTYPRTLFDSKTKKGKSMAHLALKYIKLLGYISPLGYPIPMVQAHSTTIVRGRLADIIADKFAEMLGDKSPTSELVKNLIGKSGRKLAGV